MSRLSAQIANCCFHIYEFITLRTSRSIGPCFSWRNSWQIIIDRVAAWNLRKHHESPRRASVITVRNCKSISSHVAIHLLGLSGILYPFEIQRRVLSIPCSSHKTTHFPKFNTEMLKYTISNKIIRILTEPNARSIAGNRYKVLESCEKSSILFAEAMMLWQSSSPGAVSLPLGAVSLPPGFVSLPYAGRCIVLLNRTSHSRESKCRQSRTFPSPYSIAVSFKRSRKKRYSKG